MKHSALTDRPPHLATTVLLSGIWSQLSRRRRIQLVILAPLMIISGVAEFLSLGAVLPFLMVLVEPNRLWQEPLIQLFASRVGISEASQLLMPAICIFVAATLFAAAIRVSNLWINFRMAAAVGSDLSCEAYRRILYQPYQIHVQLNSSTVITGITSNVDNTVAAIKALLQLTTSVIVASALIIGLLFIDAPVAITAASIFGVAYALLAFKSRRELTTNGLKIVHTINNRLKALQEGIGAIRDVLLDGSQSTYLEIYKKSDFPQRQLQAKNSFISAYPRFILEALGMVLIALIGGLLVMNYGNGAAVIPLLGALALGSQRLLPALQQIYNSWTILTSCNAAMASVLDLLNQPLPKNIQRASPMEFVQELCLDNVSFSYSPDLPLVLHDLNLKIRAGERIGLIGKTGCGKSTMIDLLMGLLEPSSGRIFVDGRDIHHPKSPDLVNAWRATIAHVPQNIYLADSSIAENIAFGVPKQLIDMNQVCKAASQAQISSFIEDCTHGYESFVGERGIRLSGGQRQRLGIARALYKKANVLVFDEATSALDNSTEQAVIEAIDCLQRELTIVMIAHRLSTVARFDRLIRLEQGIVVADGPPGVVLA